MAEEQGLSHLTESGAAHMVDVGDKDITRREATAEGFIEMTPELAQRFFDGDLAKGDAVAVARIAGITAAKKTPDLIPLCHPLPIDSVEVDFEPTGHGIRVVASVSTNGRTGVEMEALTAVSVAALTVYDMVKGVERGVSLASVRLLRKSGGRSGTWERE